MMAAAALASLPEPLLSMNLTGMIDTTGSTPITPTPLSPRAPMVPAVWVP